VSDALPPPPPAANPPQPPAANLSGPAALAALRRGELHGATTLDLRGCRLDALPPEVLDLAGTLERLDVSGTGLSALPPGFERLQHLHTFFASQNPFEVLPAVLGQLPRLDTLGFKSNRLVEVPDAALSPRLRWLILTDNRIATLPASLTHCLRMQKLMLAGNRLRTLPAGVGRLQRLELLRLSANDFQDEAQALTPELLGLPALAWLAHAGNPYNRPREQQALARPDVPSVPWSALQIGALLGEGASGHIHAALWPQAAGAPGGGPGVHPPPRDVAVKLFKGGMTSDGLPDSEMAAGLIAGEHPHLVGVAGRISGHPDSRQGLVMRRLPAGCRALAGPPSMASCSRDVYAPGWTLPAARARAIGDAVGAALAHLHDRGLGHGDLYAHNTLIDDDDPDSCRLSDLGAAALLPQDPGRAAALRAMDARALDILRAELQACVQGGADPARPPAHRISNSS
jgi:hypothetical protein